MKIKLTILMLFFGSITIMGQEPCKYDYTYRYKFTRKAFKNYKRGDLARTEKFIKKLRQCCYGSCGTWDDSKIDFLEIEVLNKQMKFDESLQRLDSMYYLFPQRDSLKIITLFQKFGKEKVKQAFKKVNKCNNNYIGYCVFLDDLNYKFCFLTSGDYNPNYRNSNERTENEFYDLAKDQPFYKLLQ